MAIFSRWWGGNSVGHAVDFSQANVSEWLYRLLSGASPNVGVASWHGNAFAASGTASPVSIATGLGVGRGFVAWTDGATSVTISTPSTATRIDRIVLRFTWSTQVATIALVAGSEGSGTPPALTQSNGSVWEIPLWKASITTGGIITLTDERVFVNLENSEKNQVAHGRITLVSGQPTGEASGQTTVYYTPFVGNYISLYDTASKTFKPLRFDEVSLALTGLAAHTLYDIFAYNNGGVLALEQGAAWTTSRPDTLTKVGHAYLKASDMSRLYLGTVATAFNSTVYDAESARLVYNAFNRVQRVLRESYSPGTHGATGAWTLVQTDVGEFVRGLPDGAIQLTLSICGRHSIANTPVDFAITLSISSAIPVTTSIGRISTASTTVSQYNSLSIPIQGFMGKARICPMVYMTGAGTFTFDNPAFDTGRSLLWVAGIIDF